MKHVILLLAGAAAVMSLAAAAGSSATSFEPSLEIRYEEIGCHTWSLNGGPFQVEQDVRLQAGQSILVVNHDVCLHTLVAQGRAPLGFANVAAGISARKAPEPDETAGTQAVSPAEPGSMGFGSGVRVTFSQPGEYELTTHEGAPLFGAWPTAGPDNQLVLHVRVVADHNHPPLD